MRNMYVEFSGASFGRMEVLNWIHGVSRQSQGTSSQVMSFTKYLDAKSQDLMNAAWRAQSFPSAIFTLYRNDPGETPTISLKVTLTNVTISDYKVSAAADDVPVETVSFDYKTLTYDHISPN